MTRAARILAAVFLMSGAALAPARSGGSFIILQSTTSTENSGLFAHILPLFAKKTGIEVRVVAVGTGQAIKNARNGDGDVLLVHDTPSEEAFVTEGWGVKRHDLMYNDFIIAGPSDDPARIAGEKDVAVALGKIAEAKAPFVSRGDDSGTHKAELRLWKEAGIGVKAASGAWYREIGQGMGAALNAAIGMDAYVLTDRATWSAFKNRGSHALMVEGDMRLFNQYGVILVNPGKHPNVKAAQGHAFIDWLVSEEGQAAIASFQINEKQQFFPNARR